MRYLLCYPSCMKIDIEDYEIYIKPGFTDMSNESMILTVVLEEMNLCSFDRKIFIFFG